MTPEEMNAGHVGFARAPQGWNWAAQDRDGGWYWFRERPIPDLARGQWQVGRNNIQYADQGAPNLDWIRTLRQRTE